MPLPPRASDARVKCTPRCAGRRPLAMAFVHSLKPSPLCPNILIHSPRPHATTATPHHPQQATSGMRGRSRGVKLG
eukprot:scaffold230705_cov39-Tisochrysis_lutea.AAC.3